MASSQEIVQINEIDKGLNALNSTLSKTTENYLTLVKSIESGSAAIKNSGLTFEVITKAQKETTETTQKLDAIGKQLEASEKKLKQTEDERLKTIIQNKLAAQEATKVITDKVKAEQAEEGSLVRMRQRLSELTKEYDKTGTRTKEAAKEMDTLSKEIQAAEFATNRHQRNVGNYADSLGRLPGPIGGAVSGLKSVSKTLWELVANPIGAFIAGIVAAFAALYAVFSSTASGGKLIKEVMAAISAVIDVLIQRTTVVIDAFKALFSGDFKKSADLFKQSVSGIGDAMADAAKEAAKLVGLQSELNKELAFHVSEEAKEVNAIQKAIFYSKDKTKSDQERVNYLKEAMRLSEEQAKKEGEYAQRQFVIDTEKAANKAKISGVTGEQLRAFIALDAEQQKQALSSSESLKKMYDLIGGADKFKPLEESYAKVVEADTKYFETNKRTQSQLSTLTNDLAKEREEKNKKTFDDKIALLDLNYSKEKEAANKNYITGLLSAEDYNNELLNKEEDYLKAKQALYKADTKEYADIQLQLQQIAIKRIDEVKKHEQGASKQASEVYKEGLKDSEDADKESLDNQFKESLKWWDKTDEEKKKKEEKAIEDKKELKEKEKEAEINLASEAINGVFDLQAAKFEKELSDLEKEKNEKLKNKNLTEAQKANIEKEYEKKAAVIKTKEAKNEKAQALFNIALNTAVAVMKAAPNVVLMALIGALGAVQAGFVLAQPIPKFAKGTLNAPDKGIFGELGRELMFLKSGEIAMANQATYFEGSKFKGAKILSNPETEKLIRMDYHSVGGRQMTDSKLLSDIKGELASVRKAIQDKPVMIFDKENRVIGHKIGGHQEVYLNRLIR
jgi:hypothetical protein